MRTIQPFQTSGQGLSGQHSRPHLSPRPPPGSTQHPGLHGPLSFTVSREPGGGGALPRGRKKGMRRSLGVGKVVWTLQPRVRAQKESLGSFSAAQRWHHEDTSSSPQPQGHSSLRKARWADEGGHPTKLARGSSVFLSQAEPWHLNTEQCLARRGCLRGTVHRTPWTGGRGPPMPTAHLPSPWQGCSHCLPLPTQDTQRVQIRGGFRKNSNSLSRALGLYLLPSLATEKRKHMEQSTAELGWNLGHTPTSQRLFCLKLLLRPLRLHTTLLYSEAPDILKT